MLPVPGTWGEEEHHLVAELERSIGAYTGQLDALEFRRALTQLRAIWVTGNEYVTRVAPWIAFAANPEKAAVGLRTGVNLIRLLAILAFPVMPFTSTRILDEIGVPADDRRWPDGALANELVKLGPGHVVGLPELLFVKIEERQIEEWSKRFGARLTGS